MSEMTLPYRHNDSKYKPWRFEAEHATSRSQRLPTTLSFKSGWGRDIFVTGKLAPNSSVKGNVASHYARAPALDYCCLSVF